MSELRRLSGFSIVALVGILAMLVGFGTYEVDRYTRDAYVDAAKDELLLLMTLRKSTLTQYRSTVRAEVTFWSLDRKIRQALVDLSEAWQQLGDDAGAILGPLYIEENPHPPGEKRLLVSAGDGSVYSAVHASLHPIARRFVEYRGYYDFFLIDPAGNVVYSVEKEADFATNLVYGRWRTTELGAVFRRARDRAAEGAVVFTDLARYPPSNDEPALFAATAVRREDGELLGVLAVQVPIERIREIMQFTAGMGETGETYLVGMDLLMRSDSRFSEESTILETVVDTETVRRALNGESGVDVTDDYRGVPVFSAYAPIDDEGIRWAVMAEIDVAEVLIPARERRRWIALAGVVVAAMAVATALMLRRPDEDLAA
jgi:hypothetical protein